MLYDLKLLTRPLRPSTRARFSKRYLFTAEAAGESAGVLDGTQVPIAIAAQRDCGRWALWGIFERHDEAIEFEDVLELKAYMHRHLQEYWGRFLAGYIRGKRSGLL